MQRTMRRALFVMLLAACCGCSLSPAYKRPDPPFSVPEKYEHASGPEEAAAWPEPWWQGFDDPELTRFVSRALSRNLDAAAAAARVEEYAARFSAERAGLFPALNLSAKGDRTGVGRSVEIPEFTAGLAASYEVDLFRRIRSGTEASRVELLQMEENRQTVLNTVAASTATAYLEIESLERRIAVLRESIRSYEKSLRLVELRYRRGTTMILDVKQAARLLAQARAGLPVLEQQLALAWQKLSVLCGDYPKDIPARQQPEDYFHALAPVPAGLPSELLRKRPDVRAAEAYLASTVSRTAEAHAARFPRITLTGSYGYASEALGDLLRPEGRMWSLAAGLTAPVFDAGRLKANEEAAQARSRQAEAAYWKTVLTAFSEVEEALTVNRMQEQRLLYLRDFEKQARSALSLAQSRYERGLIEYLTVLDAQQAFILARTDVINTQTALYQNRVFLHRALGGSFDLPQEENPGSPPEASAAEAGPNSGS
ncbi:MAG: efflux transporter outer membrane subunit [Thermodesulfobacteriota bacterium]